MSQSQRYGLALVLVLLTPLWCAILDAVGLMPMVMVVGDALWGK